MTSPADIPKMPGLGPAASPPAPPAPPDLSLAGRSPPVPLPPALDRADIRPLDVPGALQILIAEVRAALDEALLLATAPGTRPAPESRSGSLPSTGPAPPGSLTSEALPATAPDAARQVVALLLKVLPPESPDEAAFAQRLPSLASALQSASAQALAIIDTWRDVPAASQAAAHSAVQLAANALGEEALQAAWLRPDAAGFLPRLEQFRRRRRRLKRRLEDPDSPPGRQDDREPR